MGLNLMTGVIAMRHTRSCAIGYDGMVCQPELVTVACLSLFLRGQIG